MAGREEGIAYPDKNSEQDHAETDAPPDKFLFHGKERLSFHLFQFF